MCERARAAPAAPAPNMRCQGTCIARDPEEVAFRRDPLPSASPEGSSDRAAERMMYSIVRSPPVLAEDHAAEFAGCRAPQSGSCEREAMRDRTVGLESAPDASGRLILAIVVTVAAWEVGGLQHCHVACSRGDCGGNACAHDGREGWRCIGRIVAVAVSSRVQMLQPIMHRHAPGMDSLSS